MTFCAGAPSDGTTPGDLEVADAVSRALGTDHRSVPITRDAFVETWPIMVRSLGVPLSTPNEVAILAVAQALGRHAKVTLSGEGADELFAGYGPPLVEAERWIAQAGLGHAVPLAEWHSTTFGWVAPGMLDAILHAAPLANAGGPQALLDEIGHAYRRAGDPLRLRTHLDVQRNVNLTSLLQRLNTSTMLASVEGRTPFADVRIAELAARLPLFLHYPPATPNIDADAAVLTATLPRTKRLLRAAFADAVPHAALVRPKASFPLPFEQWLDAAAPAVAALSSESARAVLRPEAIELVGSRPAEHWRIAWPMMNIALWLQRWWG
jgi:asparagine synthase (glutamine-hydrolysing)